MTVEMIVFRIFAGGNVLVMSENPTCWRGSFFIPCHVHKVSAYRCVYQTKHTPVSHFSVLLCLTILLFANIRIPHRFGFVCVQLYVLLGYLNLPLSMPVSISPSLRFSSKFKSILNYGINFSRITVHQGHSIQHRSFSSSVGQGIESILFVRKYRSKHAC